MNDDFGTTASQGRKARTGHVGAGQGGNSMTRQEQKAVKELSTMISKNLKVVAGEHGFKVVSDCAYKVLGDFLYEVFLSAPPVRRGTAIRAVVSTKPCAIDNVFWDSM